QPLPQLRLGGVIGTGGITRRGADAAIALGDEIVVAELFRRRITPHLAADALMQPFGRGFREPVRQRLREDGGVIILLLAAARREFLDAETRADRERAQPVGR